MTDEKRHHERYNNERLELKVTRPGISGFMKLNPKARCLDYSRRGLQFSSNQAMRPGQPLILDFCVHDLELTEIQGQVISCTPGEDGSWCCRVEFSTSNKRMQASDIRNRLLLIEDKLRSLSQFSEPAIQGNAN